MTDRTVTRIPWQRACDFLRNETDGAIFSAQFIKKGGQLRNMVCRRGVTSHLRGGTLRYDPDSRNLLVVWDMQKKDYRMVNLATLVSFNFHGETFLIDDDDN